MMFRFFKKTRWFEAYFEMQDKRILDRFFDRRMEDGNHEFWLGRCYFTVFFYGHVSASQEASE